MLYLNIGDALGSIGILCSSDPHAVGGSTQKAATEIIANNNLALAA